MTQDEVQKDLRDQSQNAETLSVNKDAKSNDEASSKSGREFKKRSDKQGSRSGGRGRGGKRSHKDKTECR